MIINWKDHDLSIPIYDYELNMIHFESQRWYQLWNEPMLRFVKQVKSDIGLKMEICTENGKTIKSSQILYLSAINQDVILQRSLQKLVHAKMANVIEKDPAFFAIY